MRLRQLKVRNFRGIRELDWSPRESFVCLIGPGDSTKSTILDAIEYVLSPTWNLSITDLDFHRLDVEKPIEITAVVTGPPEQLISEDKFGLFLGFWNPRDGLHVNEVAGNAESDEKALTVKMVVRSDLEPEWWIESPQEGGPDPRRISVGDRRLLGISRIGKYTERDLAWGRSSALSRLTARSDLSEISGLLAEAGRKAVNALDDVDFGRLAEVAQDVAVAAQTMGTNPETGFQPGMDPTRVNVSQGAIALLDGKLPLHLRGAGSQRLLTMAINRASVGKGAIMLVDEIENSLEPYRLRHLIRQLRPKSGDLHQVICTTHSSVTVVECQAQELHVVRSNGGLTSVHPVGKQLQAIVRHIPEAFLSRSVIICEGKTEAGICGGLDVHYWQANSRPPLAAVGVAPVESPKSGGSAAPRYAVELAKLGYRVAYFGDSDTELNPSKKDMESEGCTVFLWEGNVETETRICRDLPMEGLQDLVELAIELDKGGGSEARVWRSVWDKVRGETVAPDELPSSVLALCTEFGEDRVRQSIGSVANANGWFKRLDKGRRLGELLAAHLANMGDTATWRTVHKLEEWCYG